MHHQQLMEKELRLTDAKLKLQLGGDCRGSHPEPAEEYHNWASAASLNMQQLSCVCHLQGLLRLMLRIHGLLQQLSLTSCPLLPWTVRAFARMGSFSCGDASQDRGLASASRHPPCQRLCVGHTLPRLRLRTEPSLCTEWHSLPLA